MKKYALLIVASCFVVGLVTARYTSSHKSGQGVGMGGYVHSVETKPYYGYKKPLVKKDIEEREEAGIAVQEEMLSNKFTELKQEWRALNDMRDAELKKQKEARDKRNAMKKILNKERSDRRGAWRDAKKKAQNALSKKDMKRYEMNIDKLEKLVGEARAALEKEKAMSK